jgi:hypothetical protein
MIRPLSRAIRERLAECRESHGGPLDAGLAAHYRRQAIREWLADITDACWRGDDIPAHAWRALARVARPADVVALRVRHRTASPPLTTGNP